MHGKYLFHTLAFFLWLPVILEAQLPPVSAGELEDLLYRNESVLYPETLLNIPEEPNFVSPDLNSSSPEELEASGLFTPYQLYNILKYREEYGEIYSIYELAALPGFHLPDLGKIDSLTSLDNSKSRNMQKSISHLVLIDLGKSFPEDEAFKVYAGSPLKTTFRFRSHPLKKLSLALTYEKDAGELFFYKHKPQFLSGYISYKGERYLKHMVIGNYQMNQGLGLVNGAGFINQTGKLRVSRQSISQIKPYASKSESSFEQGIACRFERPGLEALIWASCHTLSLSPSAFTENDDADKWLDYQRSTGYYRTVDELNGRDLAIRIHTGIQMVFRSRYLVFGVMSGSEWIKPGKKAMEYLTINPGLARSQKTSMHGNWQKNQFQVFGELAVNGSCSMACLFGTTCYFNDFIQGSLLLHHYGREYRGTYPSSYASGSTIRNEEGIAFHLHVETGKYIASELAVELFHYPGPRYLTTVPSDGYRVDLSLQNPGKQMIQWKLRLVSKTWQTNPAKESARLRPLQEFRLIRLDARLSYLHQDFFKWQSRLVISSYSQQSEPLSAFAAIQQVTIGSGEKLKTTVQFVLFRVSDWENRIYLYEPGLYYSFSFPVYYGSGQKTTVLLSLKPIGQLTFSAKVSGITNRGIRKWEAALQVKLNL